MLIKIFVEIVTFTLELPSKTSFGAQKNFRNSEILKETLKCNCSLSSDHSKTKLPSLNSSRRGASNDGCFMSIASIHDVLKFSSKSFLWYNSSSIDARAVMLPPFDASRQDEFNGGNFVFLQSLDSEQLYFKSLLEFWSFENFFELRNWFWKATLE